MANVNAPRGFKWVKSTIGGTMGPMIQHYTKKTGAALYRGQPVRIDAGAGTVYALDTTLVNNTTMVGICWGYFDSTNVDQVPIFLAKDSIFEVQVDDATLSTFAIIDVFAGSTTEFGIASVASGDATMGWSTAQLDGNENTNKGLRIVGYPTRADNEAGLYVKVYVRFMDGLFANSPQFVTTT